MLNQENRLWEGLYAPTVCERHESGPKAPPTLKPRWGEALHMKRARGTGLLWVSWWWWVGYLAADAASSARTAAWA